MGSNCVPLPVHRESASWSALSLGGGVFGLSLGKHVTQSGFYDDSCQSVKASVLGDETYGRDRTPHRGDLRRAERQDGRRPGVVQEDHRLAEQRPEESPGSDPRWVSYLRAPNSTDPRVHGMATEDKKHVFMSIAAQG